MSNLRKGYYRKKSFLVLIRNILDNSEQRYYSQLWNCFYKNPTQGNLVIIDDLGSLHFIISVDRNMNYYFEADLYCYKEFNRGGILFLVSWSKLIAKLDGESLKNLMIHTAVY